MNILHIEDNPHDAELVCELVKQEWQDCHFTLAQTREEMLRFLAGSTFDLILSDYALGNFDGREVLRAVKELAPLTPVIFVSGTIGEEAAIEVIRSGAADYVLKDRMRRLIGAMHRAIEDKRERAKRQIAEETTERFAAILEAAPNLVAMASLDGQVFYVNEAGLRMIGANPEADCAGMTMASFYAPAEAERIAKTAIPAARRNGSWVGETELLAKDGRQIPVSQIILVHPATSESEAFMSTIMHDMTRHREDERRIREQADLLNRARDAIIVTDLAGRITFWNSGAERICGWKSEEVIGRDLVGTLGTGAHAGIEMARKALETGDEWRGEFQLYAKNGDLINMDVGATLIRDDSGRPVSRLQIGTDVTAKKRLEEQFLRAQRLESIGMLASGIAHDLNNVLSPFLLAAPVLRENATNPVDLRIIESLEKSAERGAGLVRQILAFARGVAGENQLVQVKHLVRDTLSVIGETFPKNIRIEERVPNSLWPIMANPTQVHQVLLNLCVNARDAMGAGGRLLVAAENCLLDETTAPRIPGGMPGAWLVLHVEDSGTGIPPEALANIWQPFFTTKGANKGTGLGLSTVRGIVESHKGFISLDTEQGRGTIFRVYLPAADPTAGTLGADAGQGSVARGNGELVLIVDDELQIRDMAATALSKHGYRVVAAGDGTSAVSEFVAHSTEISIVVTDLRMPNLDGRDLARVVNHLNPKVKIVAMSGLSSGGANPELHRFADAFLLKPFKPQALLGTVNGLLQAGPPGKS